ncbi:DUF6122 family protein [Sediminibacterium sp.]|jgi:hypothetical protein|uniref:DUF6122 family protein n=1 Tax=unclassified Sediminibacterium TaxID=2635961 RepID=UPI00342FBE24
MGLTSILHYFLHFIAPIIVAYVFFRNHWRKVSVIFLLTMLVDLDHLLANPIFDPCRCSIGFHVLHSWYMIAVYVLLLFTRMRILGIGLLMHMLTDQIDCWMQGTYCA